MKKLMSILFLALSLANISAQSVYDTKKEDVITILNGTDSVLVPIEIFERWGNKSLEAYYNGSVEVGKKNNYSFSKWGFEIQSFEQTQLLVRRNGVIVEEFVVKKNYNGLSLCILWYFIVFLSGFLFLRYIRSDSIFILFLFSIILCGYFLYYDIYFGLLLYFGFFVIGGCIGYLSKKFKISKK